MRCINSIQRYLFVLLTVLFSTIGIHAQTAISDSISQRLELLAKSLAVTGRSVPQEEIFLHIDNTGYYVGDTIYFKAYLRLSTGQPSNLSELLYVELLDNDGYLVERQNIRLQDGQGHGSLVLTDSLYSGFYELRAYTRWQLNWGRCTHPHTQKVTRWFYSHQMRDDYYRDYEKLYSRVFPVYDKPRQAGSYSQQMTVRPLQRYYRQQTEEEKAVVTTYPEGGNLVAGVENRIAFEANNQDGQHLSGELQIQDENGKVLAKGKTLGFGRGVLTYTPQNNARNRAIFVWNGHHGSVPLPKAENGGCALKTDILGDSIMVHLSLTGQAAQIPLAMSVMSHGVMKVFRQLGQGTDLSTIVDAGKLPDGVTQLTVYSADGHVWADRLVFVRHRSFRAHNLAVTGLPADVQPYQRVDLQIEGEKNSTASIAVRDALTSPNTFDTGNILTELLLSSQIRGYVEQPDYYFEKNDHEHLQALDLLLMIQGWRRYDWFQMAVPGAFVRTEPYEKTQIMDGEVCKLPEPDDMRVYEPVEKSDRDSTLLQEADALIAKEYGLTSPDSDAIKRMHRIEYLQIVLDRERITAANLSHDVTVHAEFALDHKVNGEGYKAAEGEVQTSQKGDFQIKAPAFDGYCRFFCSASDQRKWKEGKEHVWLDDAEYRFDADGEGGLINYPEFYVRFRWPYPRFVKPYGFYQTAEPEYALDTRTDKVSSDKVHILNEVVIGASHSGMRGFDATKPAFVLDAYQAFNQTVDDGMCPGYYNGVTTFANNVARAYIGDMNMDRNYTLEVRFNGRNLSSNIPPNDLSRYEHLHFLDKVYVYSDYSPRREGDKRYSQSNQPQVIVDIRRNMDGKQYKTYRDRYEVIWGFSAPTEFYSPDYSRMPIPEAGDHRRTIYWNPDVKLDADGRATVHFYGNGKATELTVSANGMSTDGVLQSN